MRGNTEPFKKTPEELEREIARLWHHILGVHPHEESDFTRAGGSSMDAVDLQLAIQSSTGIQLPFEAVNEDTTFTTILSAIEVAGHTHGNIEEIANTTSDLDATPAQISQWILESADPGSSKYSVPILVRFHSAINQASLSKSITQVVQAHPPLRTTVRPVDETKEKFIQVVHPAPEAFPLEHRSVVSLSNSDVEAVLRELLKTPPSIIKPSVARVVALHVGDAILGVLWIVQHAAVDEWSIRVMLEDLDKALQGGEILSHAPVPHSPPDSSEEMPDAWWTRELRDIPPEIDFPAPVSGADHMVFLSESLAKDDVEAIDSTCQDIGVELATAIIHSSARAIHSVLDRPVDKLAIAVPMTVRSESRHERLMGMHLNTLPVPVDISGRDLKSSLLSTRASIKSVQKRKKCSYRKLISQCASHRIGGRDPWLDVMVGVVDRPLYSCDTFDSEMPPPLASAAPLLILVRRTAKGTLHIRMLHEPDVVDALVAQKIFDCFIEELLAIRHGAYHVSEPSVSSGESSSVSTTVIDMVSTVAQNSPDAIALVDKTSSITYSELMQLSTRVASYLNAQGAKRGDRIAIDLDPGIDFPIAVHGILLAGCVAVPLAPELPEARRSTLLSVSGVKHIFNDETILLAKTYDHVQPLTGPSITDSCYVLFTSGSTGEPRGVHMHHLPVANLIASEFRRHAEPHRSAMLAPLGFDVVFQEIYSTWACGGTLYPASADVRRDPFALCDFIQDHDITRIYVAPVLLRSIAKAVSTKPFGLPSLQEVISAGEQLVITEDIRKMSRVSGGFKLTNQYGPTETHVATSYALGDDESCWPTRPGIGKPILGVRLKVVGVDSEIVPKGTTGQLSIGGNGPALGYIGEDPDHQFQHHGDETWYATGDLVHMDTDGSIVFLGRADDQVKIAGHRVEPSEVEATVLKIDGIEHAAVIQDMFDGTTVLRCFVVADRERIPSPDDLRKRIAKLLPHFMVPSSFEFLEYLPVSSNGKLDRRGLSLRPYQRAQGDYGDRGDVGRLVELIIKKPLDNVSLPLVQQGLDSISAIDLQLEIERIYSKQIPVRQLQRFSIIQLEDFLDVAPDMTSPPAEIITTDFSTDFGRQLNSLENDLLAHAASSPQGAFHLAWRIRFDRVIDHSYVQRALERIRDQHETLRTSRSLLSGVHVIESVDMPAVHIDVLDSEPTTKVLHALLKHNLDIERGECIRAIQWTSHHGTALVVVVHHIAIDGRGAAALMSSLVRELHYVESGGLLVKESKQISIKENSFIERKNDVAWWAAHVHTLFAEQLPDIPLRGGVESESVHTLLANSVQLIEASAQSSADLNVPEIAPFIAAWAIMLGRLVCRDSVLIGVPFVSGSDPSSDVRFGVSMLPLAIDVSPQRSLNEIVSAVAHVLEGGLEHRHASVGSIVHSVSPNQAFDRTPLDGVFTVDESSPVDGATISWEPIGSSPFQASLFVSGQGEQKTIGLEIENGVLKGESIDALGERLSTVIEAVTDSIQGRTQCSVRDLSMFTDDQLNVITAFESGGESKILSSSVPHQFLKVVEAHPTETAIISGDHHYSYESIEKWSGAVAESLLRAGTQMGDRVAVFAGRGVESIVSFLGAARIGAVYVPIDADAPVVKIAQQLRVAGVDHAIEIDQIPPELRARISRIVSLPPADTVVVDPASLAKRLSRVNTDSGLYVMFTSGTTGESKAVLIHHEGVLRLVHDQWFMQTGSAPRMLNAAPLAFDASTIEIWCPLLSGGVVSCWSKPGSDLMGIADRIARDDLNSAWLTAALFQTAVDGAPQVFSGLNVVLTGGDVVSAEHVRRIQTKYSNLIVVNGYGPTENSVLTSCEVIAPGSLDGAEWVSIGRPVRGTSIRLLDEKEQRVGIGASGQIVAGGSGVGLGYLGNESSGGFFHQDGMRFYRTGDMARWLPDGRLEFLGRKDGQLKIGGKRIEITSVESAIRSCPSVVDCCVAVVGDGSRRKIVAAVAGDENLSEADLRTWLSRMLSSPEIPSTIMAVPAIPVTANGKVDRKAVAYLIKQLPVVGANVSVNDEMVQIVSGAIEDMTGRVPSSMEIPLASDGFDSIDLVRITLGLEDRLARPVDFADIVAGESTLGIARQMRSEIHRERKSVVSLRETESTDIGAVYCVPGIGGTVFSFNSILDSLGADIPVLGVPYPGMGGSSEPMSSVIDLAENASSHILKGRPADLLVGYSLGGFVAFETARKILEATGSAPKVIAIDSAPCLLPGWDLQKNKMDFLRRIKFGLESVLPPTMVSMIRNRRSSTAFDSLRSIIDGGFTALRTYNPKPAPVDMLLLRTQEEISPQAYEEDLGWSQLVAKLRIENIQGRHLDVFRGAAGMQLGHAIDAEYARTRKIGRIRNRAFLRARKSDDHA